MSSSPHPPRGSPKSYAGVHGFSVDGNPKRPRGRPPSFGAMSVGSGPPQGSPKVKQAPPKSGGPLQLPSKRPPQTPPPADSSKRPPRGHSPAPPPDLPASQRGGSARGPVAADSAPTFELLSVAADHGEVGWVEWTDLDGTVRKITAQPSSRTVVYSKNGLARDPSRSLFWTPELAQEGEAGVLVLPDAHRRIPLPRSCLAKLLGRLRGVAVAAGAQTNITDAVFVRTEASTGEPRRGSLCSCQVVTPGTSRYTAAAVSVASGAGVATADASAVLAGARRATASSDSTGTPPAPTARKWSIADPSDGGAAAAPTTPLPTSSVPVSTAHPPQTPYDPYASQVSAPAYEGPKSAPKSPPRWRRPPPPALDQGASPVGVSACGGRRASVEFLPTPRSGEQAAVVPADATSPARVMPLASTPTRYGADLHTPAYPSVIPTDEPSRLRVDSGLSGLHGAAPPPTLAPATPAQPTAAMLPSVAARPVAEPPTGTANITVVQQEGPHAPRKFRLTLRGDFRRVAVAALKRAVEPHCAIPAASQILEKDGLLLTDGMRGADFDLCDGALLFVRPDTEPSVTVVESTGGAWDRWQPATHSAAAAYRTVRVSPPRRSPHRPSQLWRPIQSQRDSPVSAVERASYNSRVEYISAPASPCSTFAAGPRPPSVHSPQATHRAKVVG